MFVRPKDEEETAMIRYTFSVTKDWSQVQETWYIWREEQMEEQRLV